MSASPAPQHELESFNHQEARFAFHHASFVDSLSVNKPRSHVIAVLAFLLVLTVACILASVVFLVILFEHRNFHAAAWAFLTVSVALGASSLFVLHLLTKLEVWHDRKTLESIKIFGLIMCVVSGISLGIYLILGVLEQNEISLEGENYYTAAIFSSACLGVSLCLYFVAQWYQNAIQYAEAVRAIDMVNIVQPAIIAHPGIDATT